VPNESQEQPAPPARGDADQDPIVADINRALVATPTGPALVVDGDLFAGIIEYVVAVTDHRDASEAVMALAHVEVPPDEVNATRARIISADDRRDQRARELADEILTALGIPS